MKLLTRRNPIPTQNSKLKLMIPYGACFHFIGLFCCKALTVKVEKTCKKTLFRGSSYEMPKVKNYLLVNLYLSIVIQK